MPGWARWTAGRLQDVFRGRLLFPIFDPSGRPVAPAAGCCPGAATRPSTKTPRSPPSTPSAEVLYGLNWAKADIINSGDVVVCEGYTDVIGYCERRGERAVATCGTALADEHFGRSRTSPGGWYWPTTRTGPVGRGPAVLRVGAPT